MKDYRIQRGDNNPAYLQLYVQLREDIVGGVYPLHSRLPSKRMLAAETGLSTITVEHAYALLCDEGYIETRERSGYFVLFRGDDGFVAAASPGLPIATAEKKQEEPEAEFPFSVLARTMRTVISEQGERSFERSPNAGCLELREAIRQYLIRSRGIRTRTEQIVIGSGSEYLYNLIVVLLGRSRRYAIESPSYHKIEQIYRASDVSYEKLPLGADGIDSAALWSCTAEVLHITPYRSFPSGVTASASKRHEYLRWAAETGRYIVEDDFESEFSVSRKPEDTLFSLADTNNIIYMNSFSRTVSPSLRVGYMVLPEVLSACFAEKLGFYSCTVPTYIQYVLAALINSGDFERHINRVRRQKRKAMESVGGPKTVHET